MASRPHTDVQALVIGSSGGDRYRVGRTVRALSSRGLVAVDAIDTDLAELLAASTTAVWLVAAGAWPAAQQPLDFPPGSQTGRPLCALGVVHASPDSANDPHESSHADWQQALAHTGGDFEQAATRPKLVSVYLEQPLAAKVAAALRGSTLDAALWSVLDAARARVVRWHGLDVCTDPRLRIAEVITSLQRGGAERMALDLTASLTQRGVFARIITTGRPTRDAFEPPPHTVDVSAASGGQTGRMEAAVRAALELHADLVHAHLLSDLALKKFRDAGLPVLLTVHNMRSGWQADPALLNRAHVSVLAACSRKVEEDVRTSGCRLPVRTIWNGIDFQSYARTPQRTLGAAKLRRKWGVGADDVVLVSLANPRPQKRLERLPAIAALLREQLALHSPPKKVRLVIAGEPSSVSSDAQQSEQALRAEIQRCNVAAEVLCVGAVQDVPTLLAACNAFVSVSAWEGLSLAMLEALAAGLPVIATEVGGAAEVAHRNPAVRLLPPEFDGESAARSILESLAAPIADGAAVAQQSFRKDQMAERYARLALRTLAVETARPRRGVWLITNNFSTGGAQSSARRLLIGLNAHGTPARAAVVQEDRANPTPGRVALETAGIPVTVVTPLGSIDPADAVEELLAAIDRDPPEAILLWNLVAPYKVLLADLLLDTPIFDISPGEMNFASLQKYFDSPQHALPYRNSTEYGARLAGAVVKYEAERERAARELGVAVAVIPNGVPVPAAPPVRTRGPRVILGTVARLSPQKKLEQLFEALRRIHATMPEYELRIAGGVDGDNHAYVAQLKESARGLNVTWLGDVQPIDGFLAELDLLVMISEPAGCPNASLEAMAAGLPVIATDFGGASEQVVDGVTGRLTPRGDVDALAAAILDAVNDRPRLAAWGRAAWERAREKFSVERMVADYERVLGIVRNG